MRIWYISLIFVVLVLGGCTAVVRDQQISQRPTFTALPERELNSEVVENDDTAEAPLPLSESDAAAAESMRQLDLAEEYFEYGKEANADSEWPEAQYNFERALSILADLDVDPALQGSVGFRQDKLLKNIRSEYKLTLLYLSNIPGEASSSAFVDRFSEIDDFQQLRTRKEIPEVEPAQIFDIPIVVNEKVENCIIYFQTIAYDFFQGALTRSGRYIPLMEKILAEEGMPHDIVYLPLIESGFKTNALSWASAVGPWQFISSTGKLYGLDRNWWYDERRDFEKSTRAAARFLKFLYDRYGDWYLAMAAYNCGPGRIDRTIQKHRTTDYWRLTSLKAETRNYIPLYLAATIIAKDPEKYGFAAYYDEPLKYKTVTVDKCLDLREVAKSLGTTYDYLISLNPELLRKVTPPDVKGYELRVPPELEGRFWAEYESFESPKHAGGIIHTVKRGENLSKIAKEYHVSTKSLARVNHLKTNSRLMVGQTILVPVSGGGPTLAEKSSSKKSSAKKGDFVAKGNVYIVRKGDSLGEIASAFGSTVSSLRDINNLSQQDQIYPGQAIVVRSGKTAGEKTFASSTTTHRVRKGDTLAKIASQYGTTVSELLTTNSLPKSGAIKVGQLLEVPANERTGTVISDFVVYVVRAGDNLWKIARSFGCTVNEIVQLNNLKSHELRVGDKLKIGRS